MLNTWFTPRSIGVSLILRYLQSQRLNGEPTCLYNRYVVDWRRGIKIHSCSIGSAMNCDNKVVEEEQDIFAFVSLIFTGEAAKHWRVQVYPCLCERFLFGLVRFPWLCACMHACMQCIATGEHNTPWMSDCGYAYLFGGEPGVAFLFVSFIVPTRWRLCKQ